MDITIGSILAIMGLTLAFTELYFPRLSSKTEIALSQLAERLRPVYLGISGAARQFHEWLKGTFIGTYYRRYHWKLFFGMSIPAAATFLFLVIQHDTLPTWIFHPVAIVISIVALLLYILTVPLVLYVYMYPLFYLCCKIVSLLVMMVAKFIWAMNVIGKQKGLSGMGLVLASCDVLTHFVK